MTKLDFRRLFTSKFFYIIVGSCLIAPILILVMTQMMEGSPMTDQHGNPILDELGNPVLMEGFKNVWQMLGSVSSTEAGMSMDITSMCNINMVFMTIIVLISIFISSEFRSGYAKNLFTVRSDKKRLCCIENVSWVCWWNFYDSFILLWFTYWWGNSRRII
jgi:ABC-type transport system involved in multi-copper enzyme maturation permease subunit